MGPAGRGAGRRFAHLVAAEDIAPRVHRPAAVMALLTGPASWQRDTTTGSARRAVGIQPAGMPLMAAATCAPDAGQCPVTGSARPSTIPGRVATQPVAGVTRWNSRAAQPIRPAGSRGSLPKKPRWLASAADQITSSDTGRHSRTRSRSTGRTRRYPFR